MSYNTDLQTNNASLQSILDAVNALPDSDSSGVELPTLSNEGSASDLLSGKQLIDSDGNVVTGTMATATQSTPTISVDSTGKITASSTQSAGYVSAGTKTATKQLTTQATKTITPTTSEQTAVAKNVYTTGVVKVAAIPSNYEDVTTETGNYTIKLSELETAIIALETELEGKASGGSGGGSSTPETCNVEIIYPDGTICPMGYYAKLVDGAVQPTNMHLITPDIDESDNSIIVLAECVCNTIVYIYDDYFALSSVQTSGGIEYVKMDANSALNAVVFTVTGDGTVELS